MPLQTILMMTKNRNPRVDYNASCINHNSSFYSVCTKSFVAVTSCLSFKWLEKRHLTCIVNVNESIGNQKRCGLWIDIDARVAFPIKTSFNAYLNCKAQMKGILCPISSQMIQFMCGTWHFSAFSAFELKLLRHQYLIDNIVNFFLLLSFLLRCSVCKGTVTAAGN